MDLPDDVDADLRAAKLLSRRAASSARDSKAVLTITSQLTAPNGGPRQIVLNAEPDAIAIGADPLHEVVDWTALKGTPMGMIQEMHARPAHAAQRLGQRGRYTEFPREKLQSVFLNLRDSAYSRDTSSLFTDVHVLDGKEKVEAAAINVEPAFLETTGEPKGATNDYVTSTCTLDSFNEAASTERFAPLYHRYATCISADASPDLFHMLGFRP